MRGIEVQQHDKGNVSLEDVDREEGVVVQKREVVENGLPEVDEELAQLDADEGVIYEYKSVDDEMDISDEMFVAHEQKGDKYVSSPIPENAQSTIDGSDMGISNKANTIANSPEQEDAIKTEILDDSKENMEQYLYEVKSGDTFEKIVKEQFKKQMQGQEVAGIKFDSLTPDQQSIVAGSFWRSLNNEQLQTINEKYTKDNIHNIHPGDKLDFSKVFGRTNNQNLEQIFASLEKGKKFEGKISKEKE
jgi:hypothetical protein